MGGWGLGWRGPNPLLSVLLSSLLSSSLPLDHPALGWNVREPQFHHPEPQAWLLLGGGSLMRGGGFIKMKASCLLSSMTTTYL